MYEADVKSLAATSLLEPLIRDQYHARLTHWGRLTHIWVSKLTIIGSDNDLSPGRRQAIIWTNDGILLIRTVGTKLSEILSQIRAFSFKKMHLKMSSVKWRSFCLGLNVLIRYTPNPWWRCDIGTLSAVLDFMLFTVMLKPYDAKCKSLCLSIAVGSRERQSARVIGHSTVCSHAYPGLQ